jgi:ribosomal protein S18 acetylase RimI-like enzyme
MISIRPATEADFPAVLDLVKELAAYLGVPEVVRNTVEQMKAEQQYFRCLVAENEQHEIVGIATYFIAYFTWFGKSLYLDDLYVKQSSRGQKIGSQLLAAIVNIAKNENCKRVRWQVSDWNTSAIGFYEKYGAEIDQEQRNCDLDAETMIKFNIAD